MRVLWPTVVVVSRYLWPISQMLPVVIAQVDSERVGEHDIFGPVSTKLGGLSQENLSAGFG